MKRLLSLTLIAVLSLGLTGLESTHAATSKIISFQAEGWVDNWYALYINGKKVGEDSVPITTVRSFNSTTIKFTASYPFTVGAVAKDYTENSSGLEYIGQPNQQIGDGGFALQIRDLSTGMIVASSSKTWKSLVVNRAPTNPTCATSANPVLDCKFANTAIPSSWSSATFNDSKWVPAVEFSKEAVGVKDGYFDIKWADTTKLIWSGDLKLDNVILFRTTIKSGVTNSTSTSTSAATTNLTVTSADVSSAGELSKSATCDGAGTSPQVSWTTPSQSIASYVVIMDTIPGPPRPGESSAPDHNSLAVYNIPGSVHSLAAANLSAGTPGLSFKGKLGYEPPCSQGPGAKIYTLTVYGLSGPLSLAQGSATKSAILEAIKGKLLTSGILSFTYTRQ